MAAAVCRPAGESERVVKVVEYKSEAGFQALRSVWNGLLAQSASKTIFLTWEWASAWWSSYGRPGELCILAAYSEDGELRGIAPLRRQMLRRFGPQVPALALIGD